jgi:hypothetical protein
MNKRRNKQKNEKNIDNNNNTRERTKVKFPEHKIKAQGNRIGEDKEGLPKKFIKFA